MKVLPKTTEVIEVPNEGLNAFLGKSIVCYCANYIYTGTLVGVNDTCIKLAKDAAIVFETGAFSSATWKDAQPLGKEHYIQLGLLESFGAGK